MKRIFYKLFTVLIPAMVLISCSNNDGEDEIGYDSDSIVLSVSKKTIAANGSDGTILNVTRGVEDITSKSVVEIIKIDGVELPTPTKLSRGAAEFTTKTPGKYTLRASLFEGGTTYSINEAEVVATESSFGKYHRKMLAMHFTSVGCVNCPALSTYIKTCRTMLYDLLQNSFIFSRIRDQNILWNWDWIN